MSLLTKVAGGITKLSELEIDTDKDWAGKKIENIGVPDSDDDAARRDTIDGKIATHAANASAHHAKTTNATEITSGIFDVARIPTHGANKHDTTVPYARAGARNIWVQPTAPTGIAVGDIWIDTSA